VSISLAILLILLVLDPWAFLRNLLRTLSLLLLVFLILFVLYLAVPPFLRGFEQGRRSAVAQAARCDAGTRACASQGALRNRTAASSSPQARVTAAAFKLPILSSKESVR
jgi:hypothetical protein